jgi:hypothetical protein
MTLGEAATIYVIASAACLVGLLVHLPDDDPEHPAPFPWYQFPAYIWAIVFPIFVLLGVPIALVVYITCHGLAHRYEMAKISLAAWCVRRFRSTGRVGRWGRKTLREFVSSWLDLPSHPDEPSDT